MPDLLDRLKTVLSNRYTLQRELGRGGMATVYLAEDLKHHRPVALKVLKPELAAVLGPERFLREIELAAKLTHPHILPVYDSGQTGGRADESAESSAIGHRLSAEFLYYVMPYVEGESLRDRLNREKQLPLDDALQISREVADALSYAHSHGVIHRDIKPENILLQGGHAVVADFGIAKAIAAAGSARLTETGLAVGTPQYMSPEQAAGEPDLDGRSDLYSLGCVLYEMLAGEPPFTGPSAQAVVAKRLSSPAPRISILRETVPAAVEAAVAKALARTPADRWVTASEFAAALAHPEGMATPLPMPQLRWRRPWTVRFAAAVVILVVIAAAVAVGRWLRPGASGSRHPRTAIAVLPFENLSGEGPHAYFAGGLHDELITQLTKVAALRPISRTSVMEYATRTKPLRQIADELAVGTIIEGSVQVVGERLRVNVQLIDAATDQHLWAERYDRTLDDAFAVQSDIAQQIVAAVGATLGGTERTAIAEAPTPNAEAYRLYLQGREYYRRPGYLQRNWEITQDFYERAVALDSTFALAHAALSVIHGWMSWFRYDPSPGRLVRQRTEAETALRLAPDLPQAHFAMGLVQHVGRQDWQGALKEYRTALDGLPNDADLWASFGATHRRLGNWDQALAAFDKVVALDPRNADALYDLGAGTFRLLRRYREAVEWGSRSLALAPHVAGADVERGWTWVLWQGQLDSLGAALDRHPPEAELGALGSASAWQALRLYWERKPDSLLALLSRTAQRVFDGIDFYLPTGLYAAWAYQLKRDDVAARAAFDSARVLLDSMAAVLPDDWRVHAARGLALAGLGRQWEAQREAGWLQQARIYREDAYAGVDVAENRARILAGIGDADAALSEIDRLLAGPSDLSVHTLQLDPRWDPIRSDPQFQALLVKYAEPQPAR